MHPTSWACAPHPSFAPFSPPSFRFCNGLRRRPSCVLSGSSKGHPFGFDWEDVWVRLERPDRNERETNGPDDEDATLDALRARRELSSDGETRAFHVHDPDVDAGVRLGTRGTLPGTHQVRWKTMRDAAGGREPSLTEPRRDVMRSEASPGASGKENVDACFKETDAAGPGPCKRSQSEANLREWSSKANWWSNKAPRPSCW